jgi:signal transduction histidine kinase
MTPQQQPTHDAAALQELGRASVEVVHDIKNQLNGLKLYATFLRKRAERDQRPTDEVETVNKIIAGLERAAEEMNLLVRYGRTLELRRASQDLAEIVRAAATARRSTRRAEIFAASSTPNDSAKRSERSMPLHAPTQTIKHTRPSRCGAKRRRAARLPSPSGAA